MLTPARAAILIKLLEQNGLRSRIRKSAARDWLRSHGYIISKPANPPGMFLIAGHGAA